MALNISSQFTDPPILDTLSPQDNQNITTNQIQSQEKTSSTNNNVSSPLAEGLKEIDPQTSQDKNKNIVVELPKTSDGKTTAPEKMDFGKYEDSFLKAAFQKIGLNDATPQEINNFQREYNSLTNNSIGLQVSLSELQNTQKQSNTGKIIVKVSDYDLKVLSAGKEQILANRQQQVETTNKAIQASRSYADDAIAGFYKVQINGLVNTANEATKIVGLPEIPKLEVKGEFWKDKKESTELATTIAAGILTGNVSGLGTAINATTGTAHAIEIVTGEDIRTGEQLSPLERSVRFVSASSSAIAVSKPAKELASKVASKFDDFNIGPPPALQPALATTNGALIGNYSASALPAIKPAPTSSLSSPNIFNQASNATNGINQLPSGNATSKASNLSDPAESAAKTEAKRLETLDVGHSLDRHGPEVTDHALQERLTKSITPNGGGNLASAPAASTRFNTYRDWIETRQSAFKSISKKEGIDFSKPPQPGQKEKYEIVVEHGKPIDDGFAGDKSSKVKNIIDPITNKKLTSYNKIDPIEGITRTYTKVVWEDNKWKVVQHYPDADGWNNSTKTYSEPADVDLSKKP
ncbi:MAG: hypothetical protein HY819_07920 [Acidobacteria bacterium]|nr:hypothetical protein [Acidobacteriota bacterium]